MEKNKNQTNFEIKQVINQPYKYGFETKIENEKIRKQAPLSMKGNQRIQFGSNEDKPKVKPLMSMKAQTSS